MCAIFSFCVVCKCFSCFIKLFIGKLRKGGTHSHRQLFIPFVWKHNFNFCSGVFYVLCLSFTFIFMDTKANGVASLCQPLRVLPTRSAATHNTGHTICLPANNPCASTYQFVFSCLLVSLLMIFFPSTVFSFHRFLIPFLFHFSIIYPLPSFLP